MMKEKIILLTPVYNDWKNLAKLLKKINNIFKKQIKTKFELIIVDDCSNEIFNFKKYKLGMISKITIISLFQNVGSQSAIAIGIKYLNSSNNKNFKTIIMDSDGQDDPKNIYKMLSLSKLKPKFSIAVNRKQRKEPVWFKLCYKIYCFLIEIFCAKKIRFGNFTLINRLHLKVLSKKNDLWSAFPPTVIKNIDKLVYLNSDRKKRLGGKSKMNFFKLGLHALKIFSVMRTKVLFFSTLYFLLILILLMFQNKIIFYILFFCLIFLNLSNYLLSINIEKKFQKNYKMKIIKVI